MHLKTLTSETIGSKLGDTPRQREQNILVAQSLCQCRRVRLVTFVGLISAPNEAGQKKADSEEKTKSLHLGALKAKAQSVRVQRSKWKPLGVRMADIGGNESFICKWIAIQT